MRNLKKLVALIVTIALMATLAIPAFAATPPDVKGTDYEGAVNRLLALGITTGYPDGNFGPNDTVTRAQAAAFVVRSLGYEEVAEAAKGVTKFSDVAANYWAAGYINLAVSLDIIKGYGNGKFGPEDKVTFDQLVTMIVRALGQGPLAETKGGFPSGYLVQAKGIGFTDGVKGVAGTNATRGTVALLIDNAKAKPIYYQEGIGDTQIYKPAVDANGNATDSFVIRLGITLLADDKIVTQTPATAGLDANKFVAGGVTYTAKEGTVDVESLLGKKVDLWGEDKDNVVLAENLVGTATAIKKVRDVTVADNVYTVKATLADGTDKDYKVAAGASAFENLAVKDIVATALDLAGKATISTTASPVNVDKTQISFVVDGDSLLFADAVIFSDKIKLSADPVENKVHKDIRLFAGFYIKYDDKSAKKVVIVKDGETVDWTALKKDDVLFVAGSGSTTNIDSNYVYIKATSKTLEGTLQSVKPGSGSATSFNIDGTWYDTSAFIASHSVAGSLGKKVIATLDPAGKIFGIANSEATASTDKYGVVLSSEKSSSLSEDVYKVRLLTSSGDKLVYTVVNNDNTKNYIADFPAPNANNNPTVGDLVQYHINADGNIDILKSEVDTDVTAGTSSTFDTSRKIYFGKEVSSDVAIYSYNSTSAAYSKIALSDIKDDSSAKVDSIVVKDGVIVAILLSGTNGGYVASQTDTTYGYVDSFEATADGYTIHLFTKDGEKTYALDDASYTPVLGNLVSFKLNASNEMVTVAKVTAAQVDEFIVSADSGKIKVDSDTVDNNHDGIADETYFYGDNAFVVYDAGDAGGAESLTADDVYADMKVTVYTVTSDDDVVSIVALVVTAM